MSARFVYRPLSAEQMGAIGNLVAADVLARFHRAQNIQDAAAKPLKPGRRGRRGYPDYKSARGLQAKRDLYWRGIMARSIKVVKSTANEVRIGLDNPQASRVAAINQRREPFFWFSPVNQQHIQELVSAAIKGSNLIQTKRIA